jgi:antitoxin HigA-1
VPTRRVYDIVQGQRTIDTDIAHRLAHYFGMSVRYWLDLQARYDGERERSILGKFQSKPTFLRAG